MNLAHRTYLFGAPGVNCPEEKVENETTMQPLKPLELPCDGVRLIEASAGTGKTYTIATLYLRLLLEQGRSVREILVVTFTQAATEELRDRIRARMREALAALQGAACDDPLLNQLLARLEDPEQAAQRLIDELTAIDEAAIFTIHGFCQRMLLENAFESGALFDTEFITDESELLAGVVEDFWRREFYGNPGLAELASDRWGTPEGLRRAIRSHVARRELVVLPELDERAFEPAVYRAVFAEMAALWAEEREAILTLIHDCKDLSRGPYKLEPVEAAALAMDEFLAAAPRDYALAPDLELFSAGKLAGAITPAKKKKGIQPPEHPFFDLCDRAIALRRMKELGLTVKAIDTCREALAARKQELAVISFDDLLASLSDALQGEGGEELARRIAERFPLALIDEFQDTDPEQYRIFATVYRERPGCGLFMIGDPKQAIYSFRGADVFTYMMAKGDTDAANDRFTLGTNWRSAEGLVQGVNVLFSGCAAPFIYQGHIDFEPVAAAGKADAKPLRVDGQVPTPLQAWFVAREPENTDRRAGKIINKGWAHQQLSLACAEEIVRLLRLGAEARATLEDAPLAPRDIAVLVRDRNEAAKVQEALRARGVASVYYSRDSVLESEEAHELLRILLAVAEPDEERALRAALCTGLLGLTAGELDALMADENGWEDLVEAFHRYHDLWLRADFMAMFRHLLHDRGIAHRLLRLEGGERRLTNLLQLAEMIQNAGREHHGIENLLHWFAEQCANPNGESEEQQLRLESDEALVKIVTIHKSKGLEYPVVFLPFLWGAKPVKSGLPPLFHEEGDERRLVLDLLADLEHYALAEKERLAEELRLLYVALTRAKHLCYFAWGHFKEADRSALAWLLHAEAADDTLEQVAERFRELDDAAMRERLEALAEGAPGCLQITEPPPLTEARYEAPAAKAGLLTARTPRRAVYQTWRVASFTGLSSNRFELERPDYGSAREDSESETRHRGPDIFRFPKGARAGTFMHAIFERLDFPLAQGEALAAEVSRQLARHGYGSEWQAIIEGMVGDVLDTPLNGSGLRLRDITARKRLNELEFYYPLARLEAGRLNALLPGLGTPRDEGPALRFDPISGVMRGFIDLVFEHGGRFYIADYKSSHLGAKVEEYGEEALQRSVVQHRYDLQYLIYTVALHRYLSHRLPGYDYATHFGGVYYLFLRGMRPAHGDRYGVHFDRPEPGLIEALDRLFAGKGRAAA